MTFTKDAYFESLINDIATWVTVLAKPITPPKPVPIGKDGLKLEFWDNNPETLMIGKLVRVVSGINAAMALAELGYVSECGAMLRIVSDFCEEIATIGAAVEARHKGTPFHEHIEGFIAHYFTPLATSPDELERETEVRYISRKQMMKVRINQVQSLGLNSNDMRKLRNYLNKVFDGFVHGYFESTMELWDPTARRFQVKGMPEAAKKEEYVDAVILKLHGVVSAIECVAAMTACEEVFNKAREARRKLDSLGLSKGPGQG